MDNLISSSFYNDPKVKEGKRLILQALEEHQAKLKEITPPNPNLIQSYDTLLRELANTRGIKLFFPYLGSGIGKGPLVELKDGSIKYDMICGIGPHYFGHSYPALVEQAIDSAISDTIMQGNLQQNGEPLELANLLIQASGFDHCFFSTTGAMANENAFKLAFQKRAPRQRIFAFEHCFAGRTLAMSQVTDKASFREGLPSSLQVDYLPFYNHERPEESITTTLHVMKKLLHRYPDQHALICVELIQGEGGFRVGCATFFKALMKLAKENGIAILVDEVQTFGRTESLFAFQHFQLQEFVDIVTIGKLSQVCATLFRTEFKPKPGLLSQTFTGSTAAFRAAIFTIEQLLNNHFFGPEGKIAGVHRHFVDGLMAIERRHPDLIQGPYGLGAMLAFTPFGGDGELVTRFVHELFHAGVIAFTAGVHPMRVRMLPPIGSIASEDIDEVLRIIERILTNF